MKFRKISILLLSLFTLSSCEFTKLSPTDMVGPDDAFKSVENVHKAVVGLYGKASLRAKLAVVEYIADDSRQGGDSGGAGTDLTNWVYAATSGDASGLWNHYYSIINQANRIIYYGAQLTPADDAQAASLNASLGTAYFFRAYAHFELLCLFSDFTDLNAAGIPYVSHYHVVGNPARDLVSDCYDQLFVDLSRAAEMVSLDTPDINANIMSSTSTAYISKVAVDALRARVSLYKKDYLAAHVYATSVLNKMSITSAENYASMWLDGSSEGVIFKLSRPAGSSSIGTIFVGTDYSSVFRPSTDIQALLGDNDTRTPLFILDGRDRGGAPTKMVGKWFGEASDIGRVDEKIFRVEEMLLIAAEALTLGDNQNLTEANKLINTLKTERYTDHTVTTYSNLMEEIQLERRLELVWEGHRFMDVRRYNQDLSRENMVLEAGNFRFVLPIPQAEIDANSNINAADQNLGY